EVRTRDVLEICEHIATGIATADLRAGHGEVDRNAAERAGIADGVDAAAAVERIGAGTALDRVVAGAADDGIGTDTAEGDQAGFGLRGAVEQKRVAAREGAAVDGEADRIRRVIEREVVAAAVEQLEGLDIDDRGRTERERRSIQHQLVQSGATVDPVVVGQVAADQDDVVAAAAVHRVVA